MKRPLQLNDDRLFPAEARTRDIARTPVSRGGEPPDHQPARPYRSRLVRGQRRVEQRDRTAARARPLSLPHALQPGDRARRIGRARPQRDAGNRSARRLAIVRVALSSLSRHPVAHVARSCIRRSLRLRHRAVGRNRRSVFRRDRRSAGDTGLSPPRIVRPVRYRTARDHRGRARGSRPSRRHPRLGLERARGHHLSSRRGRRSRASRFRHGHGALRRTDRRRRP